MPRGGACCRRAFGTLALGQRAALGQSHDANAHMPELGVANALVVAAMDQCHMMNHEKMGMTRTVEVCKDLHLLSRSGAETTIAAHSL
jgi:hypothetical protein